MNTIRAKNTRYAATRLYSHTLNDLISNKLLYIGVFIALTIDSDLSFLA